MTFLGLPRFPFFSTGNFNFQTNIYLGLTNENPRRRRYVTSLCMCGSLMGSYGILVMHAVVGIQLLEAPFIAHSAASKAHGHGRMQYFSSVFIPNGCMFWMAKLEVW